MSDERNRAAVVTSAVRRRRNTRFSKACYLGWKTGIVHSNQVRHSHQALFTGAFTMKNKVVIAVVMLAATSIAPGQKHTAKRDQRTDIEQAIRRLDDERIQAQIHADAAAIDRIYADDFIGVGPSGTVRTKPQVLADFTSRELKFQSITTDEVQGRVYENTAVETGRSTMIGQDKGKDVA